MVCATLVVVDAYGLVLGAYACDLSCNVIVRERCRGDRYGD